MEIRKSTMKDEAAIMQIYAAAKAYMIAHGNATQWGDGYPGRALLQKDIRDGNNYVMEEGGTVVGTFTFIIGEEPNYRQMENGAWHADLPYGTIHRLASSGTARGIAKACFAYCMDKIGYLRIDTHQDNLTMQAAIEKAGFRKCGTIRVGNGTERIAYDHLNPSVRR